MGKTNTVKSLNEGYIYAAPMSDNGHFGKFCITAPGVSKNIPGSVSYTSGELIVAPLVQLMDAVEIAVGLKSDNEPCYIEFQAETAPYHAVKTSGLASIPSGYPVIPATTLTATLDGTETTIPVVSTIGFPSSGTLDVKGISFSYTSKTSTSFIGPNPIGSSIPDGSAVKKLNGNIGLNGQVFDILIPQSFSANDLLGYVQVMSGQPLVSTRPVRDRGVLKSRKRVLDFERKLTIQQWYQNVSKDLMAMAQKSLAIKFERQDDMAGVVSEESYYYEAITERPVVNESLGDNNSETSFEFRFERFFVLK